MARGDEKKAELKAKYAKALGEVDGSIERSKIRAELSSADWDEDSKVLRAEVERLQRERNKSDPPKSGFVGQGVRSFQKLTTGWPWYGQLALIAIVIVAIATRPDVLRFFGWLGGLF